MMLLVQITALSALLPTAIIFGTDAFAVLVLRPSLRGLDDGELTTFVGRIHHFGDRRLPVPGMIALVSTVATVVLAIAAGATLATAAAGAALVCLVTWLVLYLTIAAPINRTFRAASHAGSTPTDARALQVRWDSIITLRAVLQGIATAALATVLMVT